MADEETTGEEATKTDEDKVREKAELRVGEKIQLWGSIGSWVFVNVLMIVIWLLSGRGSPWFLWVLFGTSIGLFFVLWNYFSGKSSESRKERMIEKEMEKIKKGE